MEHRTPAPDEACARPATAHPDPSRTIDRRRFLETGVAAGAGLVVAVYLPGGPSARVAVRGTQEAFAPNLLLRIGTDGSVTLVAPRPEMGQGVRTSLPMLVAEELAVDWTTVRVVQADLDDRFDAIGGQYVGGSNSVQRSWEPLRTAGAAAREMLMAAAAARWGVATESCEARAGRVTHPASGRSLGYGDLATEAARLPVPADPPLKAASRYEIIGTDRGQVDARDIVRGSVSFGLDVRVPGMLYAAVRHSPVFGARVGRVDEARALAIPGVRHVVVIDPETWPEFPPNSPKPPAGVAVIAESTWAALQGRAALQVSWDERGEADESSGDFWRRCERRVSGPPDRVIRHDGDVDRALRTAARRVQAVYRVPFLAHAPMEPMNATAAAEGRRVEVWVPTQNPQGAREVAALVSRLPAEAVTVHPVRMGGAFGRRFYSDFVAEAVHLAGEVDAPVKVMWSREDDIRHCFYRPAGHHVLQAGLDAEGRLSAWSHYLANASRYSALGRDAPAGAGELYADDFPAGFVPNFRLGYSAVASPIPRGQWRGIAHSANVFVVQSFVDELAQEAGIDPLEFRLRLLGPSRVSSAEDDTRRLRRVLELAAERAGWGSPLPPRHGRGIAGSLANGAFVAHVAEVEVAQDARVRVRRIVSAVDVGTVVNPNGVRAQVQGSVGQGLSAALHEEITADQGAVVQENFHNYRILRIDEMPEVEVHIIPSSLPPLGMGEGALPPVAPAVTNAIYAATGVRLRTLPIGEVGDAVSPPRR